MSEQGPLSESDPDFLLAALAAGEISDEQLDSLDALLAANSPDSLNLAQQVLNTLIIRHWMSADGDTEFAKKTLERIDQIKRNAEQQFVKDTMQRLRNAVRTDANSSVNHQKVAAIRISKRVIAGLIVLATAACVFLAFRVAIFQAPQTPPNLTVAKLISATQVVGRDGVELLPKTMLKAGDVVITGDSGSAQIEYLDGTQITLRARTELAQLKQEDRKDSKLLDLLRGEIEADFAPQPSDAPAVLTTPHARIDVIGTKFVLNVFDDYTRLEMQKGKVRMARPDGAEPYSVVESQVATIYKKQSVKIRPTRVTEGLLAFYEFREGHGDSVADTSGVLPRADLKRAPNGKIQWNPDGLMLINEHAMSTGGEFFEKSDRALTKHSRYTVEIWSYLPDKISEDKRSVHLAHFGLTGIEALNATGRKHAVTAWWTPGLRHTVEVFDEKDGYTSYDNGVANVAPVTNDTDAKIILPRLNNSNAEFALCAAAWGDNRSPQLKASFEVTYRMVAIYSRPLTADEVRRNFNAGPTSWGIPSQNSQSKN